jgi:hypothetical protein
MHRVLASFLAAACMAVPATAAAPVSADAVAEAHGRASIPDGLVFAGDLTVNFGGNVILDVTTHFHPNGALVHMDAGPQGIVVFDGSTAHLAPADAPMQRPRFHVLTWPYFAVMAYKLGDGGTTLTPMEPAPLREGGEPMRRAKLTFGDNVGDSPDDWYILYLTDDNVLKASAYIVTYGKGDDAEPQPSMIVYDDFVTVPTPKDYDAAAVISTNWTLYHWSEDKGIVGEPKGTATLENLRLVQRPVGIFDAPAGSREVTVPKS